MKKAFTLIELLVVIAIIAILAAILFPVFAQAKIAAKQSSDLSNMKQLGTGITLYTTDYDDVYPSAYFHRAFSPALGGVVGGYEHWSGMIFPYVKNWQIFVSPGDKIRGNAPTCFASANNNSGAGAPGNQAPNVCTGTAFPNVGGVIVDNQAPRLSYTANSAVLPRLRNIDDLNAGIRVVSQTTLPNVSNTIILAGLTDEGNCLNGRSISGPVRNSSHRSTNAASRAGLVQYLGERTDAVGSPLGTAPLFALNFGQIATGANNIFNLCRTAPSDTAYPLIVYHSANRWKQGDNYAMADGSAKFRTFSQTLNPSSYMWGEQMFTDGNRPLLNPLNNQPVTN